MTIRQLPNPRQQYLDGNGDPLSGGKVYTYQPGTSTPKATYADQSGSVANTNPVILDARGEAEIWWDSQYRVTVTDENDNTIYTQDNYGTGETTVLTGNFNLVQNGAFELDADGDGQPDDWDIFTYTGGTVELDDSTQSTGAQSLKFVNTGNGGGYATQANFAEVTGGDTYYWSVRVNTNNANMDIKVGVRWFDEDQSLLSESTVYNETSSAPTTWTEQSGSVAAPSGARYAKVRVYGGTGTTSATAWFDAVELVGSLVEIDVTFPNVTSAITPTSAELNKLDGFTGSKSDLNSISGHSASLNTILDNYAEQRIELGGDFDSGVEVVCIRQGNIVTITGEGGTSQSGSISSAPTSSIGVIPAEFRPSENVYNLFYANSSRTGMVNVDSGGTLTVFHRQWDGSSDTPTSTPNLSITYILTGNVT